MFPESPKVVDLYARKTYTYVAVWNPAFGRWALGTVGQDLGSGRLELIPGKPQREFAFDRAYSAGILILSRNETMDLANQIVKHHVPGDQLLVTTIIRTSVGINLIQSTQTVTVPITVGASADIMGDDLIRGIESHIAVHPGYYWRYGEKSSTVIGRAV